MFERNKCKLCGNKDIRIIKTREEDFSTDKILKISYFMRCSKCNAESTPTDDDLMMAVNLWNQQNPVVKRR